MTCSECRELLVAYAEKALDDAAQQAVGLHVQNCVGCRAEMNAFAELHEKLLRDGQILRQTSLGAAVLERISHEPARPERRSSVVIRFMRTSVGKASALAASLAIVIAAMLLILSDRSSGTAYALDALQQTVEANRSVRSIHMKIEGVADETESRETWAQFDEHGKLERLRMETPKGWKAHDSAQVTVWQNDKATVWAQKHKLAFVVKNIDEVKKLLTEGFFDPKVALEELYAEVAGGKAQIETEEPAKEGEPLKLVVTRADSPNTREDYVIDPETKLLKEIDTFNTASDVAEPQKRRLFLDYNKPIAPSVFEMKLPEDVTLIDQTTQTIGSEKGKLTDDEIAAKVAREFFEALAAKDYDKAGQLFNGIPGDRLKQLLRLEDEWRIVSLVSVGKPVRLSDGKLAGNLVVPCKIEVEANGAKSVQSQGIIVQPVPGQPDRWTVNGLTGSPE